MTDGRLPGRHLGCVHKEGKAQRQCYVCMCVCMCVHVYERAHGVACSPRSASEVGLGLRVRVCGMWCFGALRLTKRQRQGERVSELYVEMAMAMTMTGSVRGVHGVSGRLLGQELWHPWDVERGLGRHYKKQETGQ